MLLPSPIRSERSAAGRPLYSKLRKRRTAQLASLTGSRLAGVMTILAALAIAPAFRAQQQVCVTEPRPGCQSKPLIDLVFVLDKSGSVLERGQTYNVMVRGVAQALRDPTIIPYDGTVAIAVVSFAESADESVPMQVINSPAQAEAAARSVDRLQLTINCDSAGVRPASNYTAAIRKADQLLNRHAQDAPAAPTRSNRAILLCTDGEPTDQDMGLGAAIAARDNASRAAIEGNPVHLRLDAILLGLRADAAPDSDAARAFQKSRDILDQLVFRVPATDKPGATFPINAGACNLPCAGPGGADCDRQAREFSELTRQVLRGYVTQISLVVTRAADTEPNQPVSSGDGQPDLSLRQAIERANCNQGSATITFADGVRGKTISPRIPLPALTAPDIRIDGCGDGDCAAVTIDGALTDTSKGERHEDGLLIRSNHDAVRGLKIVNCKRAGVEIAARCPLDFVGHSLIELNVLENNARAGVLVVDLPQDSETIALHNVGNTISKNEILIEKIPADAALIDLGGEGPTANDDGDTDEGSNRLLNFPDSLNVVESTAALARRSSGAPKMAAVGDFTVSGQSFSPQAANATVEIFAITRLRAEANRLIIEAVAFRQQAVADATGAFTATGVAPSPTGVFTATLTDQEGNTSELMFGCAGPARMVKVLDGGGDTLDFGTVAVPDSPKLKKQRTRQFKIQNMGCSPLKLRFMSLRRSSAEASKLKTGKDDTELFSVMRVVTSGQGVFEEEVSFTNNAADLTINPGSSETFVVRFRPVVPPVAECQCNNNLSPADVLPDRITSRITFLHNDETDTIELRANLKTALRLINPTRAEPRQPPRVTLTRSGDELMAQFSIYDPNLNVRTASYEFFDKANRRIRLTPSDSDLASLINGVVVPGQSFTVKQKFSNAKQHPEVDHLVVRVTDGEATVAATSGPAASASVAARRLSQKEQRAALLLPPLRLQSAPHEHAARAGSATGARRYYGTNSRRR